MLPASHFPAQDPYAECPHFVTLISAQVLNCESRGFAPPWESLRLEELDPQVLAATAGRMGIQVPTSA
jgi:hypothetical protein